MERERFSKEDLDYIKKWSAIFAQKWTVGIVAALPQNGNEGIGFNELMKQLDGISAAVLSNRLKALQKLGYVERKVRIGPPTRTRYTLVGNGKILIEIANSILDRRDSKQ
ncbi:MAG: helix-turn-helix domain-containing protein [Candidatus Micrarchaeota archaeon]|nr:helix-turn-helix domain-containing protein [Candidatus Micrarchaeota archaeon]